ncbi:MAG: L-threonylcarbamoyladenylate synthase [Betaproteobacteria bacterium]|nr:L-threonylcarbamoyladenylate synthase [Betaproteobacteria bacterium]
MTGRLNWRGHLGPKTVIAYPTESCFGLGCDPWAPRAVRRILQMKRRSQAKGLIVLAATVEQLSPFVTKDSLQAAWGSGLWPGPVTFLLPASRRCPVWLRGRHNTIAVRLTGFAPARALCRRLGTALVSTSANRSGQRAVRTAHEVKRVFGSQVTLVGGQSGRAKRPSQIRDWATGRVVRD